METAQTQLLNHFAMNTSSVIQCTEPFNEALSTEVTIVSDFELPITSLSKSDDHPNIISRPVFAKSMSMGAIGRQFLARKFLQTRLRVVSDITCFLGLLGLILMVIKNEITFLNTNDDQDTRISWLIKLIITISTVILVSLVIFYHYLNLKLYATQNSLDDWHIGLTTKRLFLIIFEILICGIHPMPRSFPSNWVSINEDIKINETISDSSLDRSYISTDVALSLPMFGRLYLIFRCIMFHSHLFRDAPSKSLGSINQVSINFPFLMKTYLVKWPGRCLILISSMIFFIGSWSLRACDYRPTDNKHISMFDSTWLFIITLTTVGYGDLIPSTYCGRTVVSIIILFGLLSSALLISVVTKKLELTRWEKYVHYFVSDIELQQERRKQAANIIKFAIKVWYLKRKTRSLRSFQYLKSQRLLYKSIYLHRQIKQEQRKSNENCLDFVESINIQRYTSIKTKKIAKDLIIIQSKIDTIEQNFTNINIVMTNIQNTLDVFIEKNIK